MPNPSIPLEGIFDNSPAARNFKALADRVIDTGGQKVGIRFGTASVAWPGAAVVSSFSAAIPHGLGTTPVAAFLTPKSQAATSPVFAWFEVMSATAFSFRASTGPGGFAPAAATTQTFYWLVMG